MCIRDSDVDELDDLEEKLNDLTDASDKLVDGSDDLYDNLKLFDSKMGELNTSVKKFQKEGVNQLANGISTLAKGAPTLVKGVTDYANGVTTVSYTHLIYLVCCCFIVGADKGNLIVITL